MHGLCVVGHRCQARNDRAWAGGRGTVGASQGKVYYEVTVADEGLCRVGWATRQAGLDLGTEPISFGFGGTGGNATASEHAAASEWCEATECSLTMHKQAYEEMQLGPHKVPRAIIVQHL